MTIAERRKSQTRLGVSIAPLRPRKFNRLLVARGSVFSKTETAVSLRGAVSSYVRQLTKRHTARQDGADTSAWQRKERCREVRPERVACAHRLLTNLGRASASRELRARSPMPCTAPALIVPSRSRWLISTPIALPAISLPRVIALFLGTFFLEFVSHTSVLRLLPSFLFSFRYRHIALLLSAGFKRKTAMRHEILAIFRVSVKERKQPRSYVNLYTLIYQSMWQVYDLTPKVIAA